MSSKVLLVEDEPDIRELVSYNLRKSGFEVATADDGETALSNIEKEDPDLVILDLMLPGVDGLEVCRLLKQNETAKEIPVLMLTARSDEVDRIVGLELGADDYVVKPFSPRELVLRVRAILRRGHPGREAPPGDEGETIEAGPLRIDSQEYCVYLHGKPLELTATEFKLLRTLVERRGRVQSRQELLNTVWEYQYAGYARTVDTHVRRLREKLGPAASLVETVRGVGYRFKRQAG